MKLGLTISAFFFNELGGSTPNTVRCNIEAGLLIFSFFFFFSSELAGGTPHTVTGFVQVKENLESHGIEV